jgi:hypothetical protein
MDPAKYQMRFTVVKAAVTFSALSMRGVPQTNDSLAISLTSPSLPDSQTAG